VRTVRRESFETAPGRGEGGEDSSALQDLDLNTVRGGAVEYRQHVQAIKLRAKKLA